MSLTVNDRTFDSGKGEIRFNKTAALIQKIGFGDKLNTEIVRRIGSQEIEAITDGEYETEDVSVTVEQAIWLRDILPYLPKNGFGSFRFMINVHLNDPELGKLHVKMERCRIVGVKDAIENGPGALVAELTIRTRQISRNGHTLNRRRGVPAGGAADTGRL